MNKEEWKKCCLKEIKKLWEGAGGSMNVVYYKGKCPKCGHFIGLTQTSKKEAQKILSGSSLKSK